MRSSLPTSSRSGSLPCLHEEDSESSECAEAESFEDIVEEAVVGLAACIYEQHKDGDQNACILAAESVFQVDDALSWLECMTMPNIMETNTPESQFHAFVRNLVRLRHLVCRENLQSLEQLQTTAVTAHTIRPADMFRYVFRFVRLYRSGKAHPTSDSCRLVALESTLRLFVSDVDAVTELSPLKPSYSLIS